MATYSHPFSGKIGGGITTSELKLAGSLPTVSSVASDMWMRARISEGGGTYYVDESGQGYSIDPAQIADAEKSSVIVAPAVQPTPAGAVSPPSTLTTQFAVAEQERQYRLGTQLYETTGLEGRTVLRASTLLSPYGYEYIGGFFTGKSEEVVKRKAGRDVYYYVSGKETKMQAQRRGVWEGLQSPPVAVMASYGVGAGFGVAGVAATGKGVVLGTKAKVIAGTGIAGFTGLESYSIALDYPEHPERAIGRGITLGASVGAGFAGYRAGRGWATKSPLFKKQFTTEKLVAQVQYGEKVQVKKPGFRSAYETVGKRDITTTKKIISRKPPKIEPYTLRHEKTVKIYSGLRSGESGGTLKQQATVYVPEKAVPIKQVVWKPADIKPTPLSKHFTKPPATKPVSVNAAARANTFARGGQATILKPTTLPKIKPFSPTITATVRTPGTITMTIPGYKSEQAVTSQRATLTQRATTTTPAQKTGLQFASKQDQINLRSLIQTPKRTTIPIMGQITRQTTGQIIETTLKPRITSPPRPPTTTIITPNIPITPPITPPKLPPVATLLGGDTSIKSGFFRTKTPKRKYAYQPSLIGLLTPAKTKLPRILTGLGVRLRRKKK